MTELEVAQGISKGEMPSPTMFGDMALFALRITGTGLSYRTAHDEFVWRDPSIYLNDEFLGRCAGLPVIWEHPTKASALNSEEFGTRVIGTVMLPYIQGEDVWAVCRIYDGKSIEAMTKGQLSTSPAVVFKSTDGNEKVDLGDGGVMLIEGKPFYLDHLAVVDLGVWDKEGPPTGVQNDTLTNGAAAMADEDKEKAAADARHDERLAKMDERFEKMDSKFDAIMDAMMADRKDRKDSARRDSARKDRFGKRKDGESYKDYKGRHDADEKAMCDALRKDGDESEEDCMDAAKDSRHDAEEDEKRHDKDFEKWAKEEEEEPEHKDSKKDAEEEPEDKKEEKEMEKSEKEEERPDSRKDSAAARENAELRQRLKSLEDMVKGTIKREVPQSEIDSLAAAQARADSVAAMFGDRALPPSPGETPLDYRRRLIKRFQRHSPKYKETRMDRLEAEVLDSVEDCVYADAVQSARNTTEASPGVLVPFVERDMAGRQITRFHGDVAAFLAPFVPQDVQKVKVLRPQRGY